jgi:L-methionine (R)-S-oxide reductase
MPAMNDHAQVVEQIRDFASGASDANIVMAEAVKVLRRERPHYHWVGVYLLQGETLVLGPYAGKPTAHTRIPLNQGICGAAASSGRTIIVDDVNADSRYLACSLETRSEIVVPIQRHGKILGEIDIDSDAPAAFKDDDRTLLEAVAGILAAKL